MNLVQVLLLVVIAFCTTQGIYCSSIPFDTVHQWNQRATPKAVFKDVSQTERVSIRYGIQKLIEATFGERLRQDASTTVDTIVAQRLYETTHFIRQSAWQLTSAWNETDANQGEDKRELSRLGRVAETICYYCAYKQQLDVEDVPKVKAFNEEIPETHKRKEPGTTCKLLNESSASNMERLRYIIDKSFSAQREYMLKLSEEKVNAYEQCIKSLSGDCAGNEQINSTDRLLLRMQALMAAASYEMKVSPKDVPEATEIEIIAPENGLGVLLEFVPLAATLFSSLNQDVQDRFLYAIQTQNYQVLEATQALPRLFQVLMINQEMHERQLPEVYLLGVPKAGTTALWKCIAESGAFSKTTLCGSDTNNCGAKKYYYPGRAKTTVRKEFFFFNHPSMAQLHRSPQWRLFYKDFPLRSTVDESAISVDATPNYFGNNNAYLILYLASRDQKNLRFLVNLRNPIYRAFSSWSMFINWKWRQDTFKEAYQKDILQLETCFPEIRDGPEAVFNMSFYEYSKKHTKCILGEWKHVVSNGLYALHLRNWFQYFNITQFSFAFQEDLYNMTVQQTVRLAAEATGMSVPEEYLAQLDHFDAMNHSDPKNERPGGELQKLSQTSVKIRNICEARGFQHQSHKDGPKAEDVEFLQQYFEPWNNFLREELKQMGVQVPF